MTLLMVGSNSRAVPHDQLKIVLDARVDVYSYGLLL